MNRSIYFASVAVALISVLLVVQMMGGVPQATASVSPQFAIESSATVAPDSSSAAVEALAAWPAAATR